MVRNERLCSKVWVTSSKVYFQDLLATIGLTLCLWRPFFGRLSRFRLCFVSRLQLQELLAFPRKNPFRQTRSIDQNLRYLKKNEVGAGSSFPGQRLDWSSETNRWKGPKPVRSPKIVGSEHKSCSLHFLLS